MCTLNDPAAHLLDEVIQPARLSKQPTSSGLNGNKPAQQFTMSEQNITRDVKQMWHRKNKVWALIDKMVQSGFSAEVAINRIEQVYGSDVSITMLIQKIMANKDGHLSLR